MKPHNLLQRATAITALLASHSAHAATGTWNVDTNGLWSLNTNWLSNTIADGSGFTANFNNNITADRAVSLDNDRTLTGLVFGDSDTSSAGSWILDNNGTSTNNLILAGTTATIRVNALGTAKTATISAIIEGTAGLTKSGIGTLAITGVNTYTGKTTIQGGTLQIGNGGGSLNGITGTALTFAGTGTFNVKEAASSTQGMGVLSFSAGEGTVLSTAAGSTSAATLTFSSMAARSAGATANFNIVTNTTAASNKIALTSTANAPLNTGSNNPGIFFNINDALGTGGYARYDATNGYFRQTLYGTDTNAPAAFAGGTTLGTTTSATDVSLTGAITAQTSAAVNTVKTTNAITLTAANTLSVNGILLVTGNTARIVGPNTTFLQPTSDGGELILAHLPNSTTATGALQIASKIQDFSGGSSATKVTKAGIGMVTMVSANTYTGVTTLNSGILRVNTFANVNTASGIGKGSVGGSAADLVINGGTLQYSNQAVAASTNRLFTIGVAGATLDASGSSGTGTLNIGSGGGNIAFSSISDPASLTLTGTGTGATGTGTLSAVLGDSGSGANITSLTKSGVGTWIIAGANTHSGVTTISAGTLQLGINSALQNSIFDTSGAGSLTFSSGINTPTFGGLTSATNLTMASNVTALTLNPGTGVTTTYSGILGSTTAGMTLTKTGTGKQVLTGTNTYTGATNVNAGTLAITGSGSINASSGVTVAAGANFVYNSSATITNSLSLSGAGILSRAILGGSGTIGAALTLNNLGDTLSPGNSPGIQTFTTAQTWSSFSYDWEVNNFTGTTAGTDFDRLGLNTLDLTGTVGSYILNVLSLTASNVAGNVPNFSEVNRSWTILTSSGGITGFNAANWTINTTGFTDVTTGNWALAQTDNDLVLSYAAVPEPDVAALIGGLGMLVLLRRRR